MAHNFTLIYYKGVFICVQGGVHFRFVSSCSLFLLCDYYVTAFLYQSVLCFPLVQFCLRTVFMSPVSLSVFPVYSVHSVSSKFSIFANVSIHYYGLSSVAQCERPQLFSLPLQLGSSLAWSLYLIAVICTCILPRWHSPKDVHVHLTVTVYTFTKHLSFSAYQ